MNRITLGLAMAAGMLAGVTAWADGSAPAQDSYVKIEAASLVRSPQNSWARAILFSDVLVTPPSGNLQRLDRKNYQSMKLKTAGLVWVPDNLAPKFKVLQAGKSYSFAGTVDQISRRYYVIIDGCYHIQSSEYLPEVWTDMLNPPPVATGSAGQGEVFDSSILNVEEAIAPAPVAESVAELSTTEPAPEEAPAAAVAEEPSPPPELEAAVQEPEVAAAEEPPTPAPEPVLEEASAVSEPKPEIIPLVSIRPIKVELAQTKEAARPADLSKPTVNKRQARKEAAAKKAADWKAQKEAAAMDAAAQKALWEEAKRQVWEENQALKRKAKQQRESEAVQPPAIMEKVTEKQEPPTEASPATLPEWMQPVSF